MFSLGVCFVGICRATNKVFNEGSCGEVGEARKPKAEPADSLPRASPSQSCTSKGIGRQGIGSFCKETQCFHYTLSSCALTSARIPLEPFFLSCCSRQRDSHLLGWGAREAHPPPLRKMVQSLSNICLYLQ